MDDRPAFLTPEELSARYRGAISVRTLSNWRASVPRRGPAYIKTGKVVLYPVEAVELWEARNTVRP